MVVGLGLIATGQKQSRYLLRCRVTNCNPGGPGEAHSRNCQTWAATPAEPWDLRTDSRRSKAREVGAVTWHTSSQKLSRR